MEEIREARKNFTFSIRPSVQSLLAWMSIREDKSQGKVLEELIRERAKRLKKI